MNILFYFLFIKALSIVPVNSYLELPPLTSTNALDVNLYEEVLDSEECERQLTYLYNNDTMLQLQFMDAGVRTPRGILYANLRDMGNYLQCLDISQDVQKVAMSIDGKYCVMQIPLLQENIDISDIGQFPWLNLPWSEFDHVSKMMDAETLNNLYTYNHGKRNLQVFLGDNAEKPLSRVAEDNPLSRLEFELAICIPKVCSVTKALDTLQQDIPNTLDIREAFCRLPDDKPWVPVEYIAIVIFSIIGFVTILSTSYDIRHSVILKRDPKRANKLCMSFSVFTNTRKFFTFKSSPNAINSLDGIRSFAMLWVIVGHTFFTQLSSVPANFVDIVDFMRSYWSLWITSATITVDTFFMISGLLIVYTTASKLSRRSLIKNLHLFYLNRLLRMFPVLATAIILQAAILNRVTDGPYWHEVARYTNSCRQYWWSTLLYVQNFVNPETMCLIHSWYLAIDMQLYILSPIVLYWVLGGNKRSAWTALTVSFIAVLTGGTIYNFLQEFQSAAISLSRSAEDGTHYLTKYYLHTLPRASPFFVGMIFGYMMHLCKGKKIVIPKYQVVCFWILATVASFTVISSTYFVIQPEWDNQIVDSILNSFMRPAWAASVAWMVFACHHGYGGPVNWVLTLHVFKILGRLSYAMYIFHLPQQYLLNATALAPVFFSVEFSMHRFLVDFSLAVITSFIVTILIDLPFTGLIGMLLGGGRRNNDAKKDKEIIRSDDVAKVSNADPQKTAL